MSSMLKTSVLTLTAQTVAGNMKRLTLKSINMKAAPLGFELVKGSCYFYWAALTAEETILRDSMVLVSSLNQIPTIDGWIDDLKEKIEETQTGRLNNERF